MPSEDARLGAALRELLKVSYGLIPEDLPATVRDVATRHLGATDAVLFLVDLDQTELRPLAPDRPELRAHGVDTTIAGQAFREERPVVEPSPDGRRLWLPVLDSAERLGVLAVLDDGDVTPETWMQLASLVGELVMGKQLYGDAIAKLRRTGDLTLAAEMRWSLLPPLTFTSPDVGISGILMPSRLIAGDVFDYAVTGRRASVALFDAMGHGLEASRMANLAVGTYRNVRRGEGGLGDVLSTLDAVLESQFGEARFVTAQVAQLELDTGELHIASAGHPSPVLLPADADASPQRIELPPCRPPGLGYTGAREIVVQLSEGDAILFHTDGVSEARSPDREVYGERRMAEAVWAALKAGARPPEALRLVIHEVLAFQGERVRDDASMVLLSWRPAAVTPPSHAGTVVIS